MPANWLLWSTERIAASSPPLKNYSGLLTQPFSGPKSQPCAFMCEKKLSRSWLSSSKTCRVKPGYKPSNRNRSLIILHSLSNAAPKNSLAAARAGSPSKSFVTWGYLFAIHCSKSNLGNQNPSNNSRLGAIFQVSRYSGLHLSGTPVVGGGQCFRSLFVIVLVRPASASSRLL